MLSDRPECTVVGQVGGEEIEVALDVYRPDMLLWDLGWDPAAELERLGLIQDIDVVGLLPDESQTGEAWSAGVRGLLLRDVGVDALVSAIISVSQGMVVLDPGLAAAALPATRPRDDPPVEHLTHRELEVLRLLAEGLPNKTIAPRLGISEHTVKFHVNSVMVKLGASSRTDAVVAATRMGLILL